MYKKILCISILAFGLNSNILAEEDFSDEDYSSNDTVNNYNPGIYFGGQAGMSHMHYSNRYSGATGSIDNKKFAARGYLGYAFSQFIALELGYDYYGNPTFKDSNGSKQDFLQHGFDFVAKASLPLDYGFGFYIKGGLAWVHRGALHSNNGQFAERADNGTFAPVGCLGVNYWFAPNIALDLSWTKTMTISDLPTIDFFSLGFTYKINI